MSVLSEIRRILEFGNLRTSARLSAVEAMVPGIAAADAFDAGDAVGDVFSVEVPTAGWITGFKLIDPDDDTLALTAHVFSERFIGAASDAAFTISAADALKWITSVTFSSTVDIGSAKVSEVTGETFYRSPSGKLWIQCSTTGTPSIAAGVMPILQIGIRPAAGA